MLSQKSTPISVEPSGHTSPVQPVSQSQLDGWMTQELQADGQAASAQVQGHAGRAQAGAARRVTRRQKEAARRIMRGARAGPSFVGIQSH
jgi:hypothetical protein